MSVTWVRKTHMTPWSECMDINNNRVTCALPNAPGGLQNQTRIENDNKMSSGGQSQECNRNACPGESSKFQCFNQNFDF